MRSNGTIDQEIKERGIQMDYISLNDGNRLPAFGLGTWGLRGKSCEETVSKAIALGYTLIDTARMYGNEKEVGRGIRLSGVKREKLFVTTKVCSPYTSYSAAKRIIEESLDALGLNYIDLYLIHEPYDSSIEMYEALKEAKKKGLIRSIGISNFNEEEYLSFIKKCGIIPAVNQVENHVYFLRSKLQETMAAHGTVMQGWAPFTENMRPIFKEKILNEIGNRHGKTAGQIALKYLLQSGVPTVAKSSHAERLKENLDIFDFSLSTDEMKEIHRLDEGKSLFGWY